METGVQVGRERKSLTNERIRHVNRIKGLLFGQGIHGFEPLRRDRRKRLDELTTGDGRALPTQLSRSARPTPSVSKQVSKSVSSLIGHLAIQGDATYQLANS
jgi:transposase